MIAALERLRPPAFAPGSVWLVGAGPGDPGLLTLHALHALAEADVVLHDALVAPEILALAAPAARLEPVGKRAGRPSASQLRINARLVALARDGLRVLRLKGGDPLTFGRGGEEAMALALAGIPFRIVPGISAAAGAAAYAGIPPTHRGLGRAVVHATGHATGDPDGATDWAALARSGDVLVLYMALGRLGAIADALVAGGRARDEPVALVSDATTPRQRVRITTLAAAASADVPPDAATLVVVGPTVALAAVLAGGLQADPFTLYPAAPVLAAGGDRP